MLGCNVNLNLLLKSDDSSFCMSGFISKRTKTLLRLIEPIRHLSPVFGDFVVAIQTFGKQYSVFNYLKILVDRDIVGRSPFYSSSHEISSAMNDIVSGESLFY